MASFLEGLKDKLSSKSTEDKTAEAAKKAAETAKTEAEEKAEAAKKAAEEAKAKVQADAKAKAEKIAAEKAEADAAAAKAKAEAEAKAKAAASSVEDVAKKVIRGDFGNGAERVEKLKAAGYDADKVQAKVNELLGSASTKASSASKSVEAVAKEVIQGKWGNGAERVQKLKAAGYDAEAVQNMVNKLLG